MKAARLYEYSKDLVIEDISMPTLGPNDALVKVKACGVCHSDIHMINGAIRLPSLPRTLGHEVSGEVVEVGRSVHKISVGDRVAISFIHKTCGSCRYCTEGLENTCQNALYTGFHVDGGYAEYIKAYEDFLFRIPDKVSYEEGALATDSIATSYHAIKRVAKISINERVAVYGLGGLGLSAIQILKAIGAYVIGIDINEEKLKLAQELGVDEIINSSFEDPVKRIRSIGGVDAVLDFTSSSRTKEQGFESIRPHGRLVIVGIAHDKVSFSPRRIVFGEMSINGSFLFTRQDIVESLDLINKRIIKVVYDSYSLQDVNKALKLLKEGKVLYRSVVKP